MVRIVGDDPLDLDVCFRMGVERLLERELLGRKRNSIIVAMELCIFVLILKRFSRNGPLWGCTSRM